MPNWSHVLNEIAIEQATATVFPHDVIRRRYLQKLFDHTDRNVIAYYSGFLNKRAEGIEVNDEDKNAFMLCINELDRSKGLDLILHTPGGDAHATLSLVDYLRSMFGSDMRAIVPQLAMSAGTMIACSCKSIVMGKHSSLGPVDPQFGSVAAANLLAEVKRAKTEILANPGASLFWNPILSKITPSFLERCELAIEDSNQFLDETLRDNMLSSLAKPEQDTAVENIIDVFANNIGKAHNTHIPAKRCAELGLKIEELESDQTLQDLVLTIHHCYMHTLSNTAALKIVENHMGRALVKQVAVNFVPMVQPQGAYLPPSVDSD
ncbi:ATP-dependent Clp protease proteolytic subunit [Rhizobium sp. DKSPLA3]|uniref:ATP-dependent Clp protease proteolytic subunit n=1 Tax=Rhizobium quercicola TaxID=2901226 RepID=A0A9X1T0M3_9HYPH|nr:ATP-dependent Clp protease proteolytic subunit [Rhizobium quercicola]MCD7109691.1 ATP-dependent Clp protease proteolytic subunit [Rhizobium quercicola]